MFFDLLLALTINLETFSIDSEVLRSFGFRFKTHINLFGSAADTAVVWGTQWNQSKSKNGINKSL